MKAIRLKRTAILVLFIFVSLYVLTPVIVKADRSQFANAAELVKEKKFIDAFLIFKTLAQENDPEAQFNVAVMLRRGVGHPSHYADALKWAWLAELGGVSRAGALREELIDLVPNDQLELVRSQVKAILNTRMDQGDSTVILQMADYHLNVEAEPDYKNAYALRSLAAALSIKNALLLRDEIESELEPADLIEAQIIAGKLFSAVTWVSEPTE